MKKSNTIGKNIHKVLVKLALCISMVLSLSTQSLANNSFDIKRMEYIVQSYVKGGVFTGSVLVAQADEVIFSKGYGSANLEWNIANSPKSIFRIASVSKQFTAAAILLLEQQGKLIVDDKISNYLLDPPKTWRDITFRHLLTHSSGLADFTQFPNHPILKKNALSVDKLIAIFKGKPLDFEPGQQMRYSNSGYVLLGYLIERISSKSYSSFIKTNIFDALAMNDSGYDFNASIIKNRAAGYMPSANGIINANHVDMSTVYAAGGLYSTTEDLLRWTQGLFSGALLSKESLNKMTSVFKRNYGFGLSISDANGIRRYHHGGAIDGFTAELIYYPKQKITVAVLSNLYGAGPAEIAPMLGELAHGKSVTLKSERSQIKVAAKVLQSYVGIYQMESKGINTKIMLLDNQLTAQLPGMPAMALLATSNTEFFLNDINVQVTFMTNATDNKKHIIIDINGQSIKGQPISDTVKKKIEIKVPNKVLTDYIGTYRIRRGLDIFISINQGRLMGKTTGQPSIALYAQTSTLFFSDMPELQVEFHKSNTGKVSHLVLMQGHNKAKAKRQSE